MSLSKNIIRLREHHTADKTVIKLYAVYVCLQKSSWKTMWSIWVYINSI